MNAIPAVLTDRIAAINQMPVGDTRDEAIINFSLSPEMIALAKSNADAYVGSVELMLVGLPHEDYKNGLLALITGMLGNAEGMSNELYFQLLEKFGCLGGGPDPLDSFFGDSDKWSQVLDAAHDFVARNGSSPESGTGPATGGGKLEP